MPLAIKGRASDPAVRRVSTASPPGDLSLARALRVRDALAERAGRDPWRIEVAGLGASPDHGGGRIEIAFGAVGR